MKVIIKTKVLSLPQDQGSPPSYLMKVIIKTKVLLPRT